MVSFEGYLLDSSRLHEDRTGRQRELVLNNLCIGELT